MRRRTGFAGVVMGTILIIACGGGATQQATPASTQAAAAPSAAPSTPKPLDPVKVVFGTGAALGQYGVAMYTANLAIYTKYGIAPTFIEGQGSATSAQLIDNGQADFGVSISAAGLIATVARGAGLKMVSQDTPVGGVAVLSNAPKLITTPQELVGKTIGLPPGTAQAQIFPAFLKANGMTASQINLINSPLTGIQEALIAGRLEGYVSYAQSNMPLLKSLGATGANAMLLADFGFQLSPDSGVVTTDRLIKSNSDLVKRFVAAVEESVSYSLENVAAACDSALKVFPQAIKTPVCVEQMNLEVTIMKKYRAPGQPIGRMAEAGWKAQIDALTTYGGVPVFGKLSDYYTNEFVPAK